LYAQGARGQAGSRLSWKTFRPCAPLTGLTGTRIPSGFPNDRNSTALPLIASSPARRNLHEPIHKKKPQSSPPSSGWSGAEPSLWTRRPRRCACVECVAAGAGSSGNCRTISRSRDPKSARLPDCGRDTIRIRRRGQMLPTAPDETHCAPLLGSGGSYELGGRYVGRSAVVGSYASSGKTEWGYFMFPFYLI